MCFSATASFTSSAAVAVVGVATLARTQHKNEWLFAAVPLLFAWHQFNEGMIWLGLTGDLAFGNLPGWGLVYMLYAQGLFPLLIPLSVWLIEPNRRHGRWILPFLLLGGATPCSWCHDDRRQEGPRSSAMRRSRPAPPPLRRAFTCRPTHPVIAATRPPRRWFARDHHRTSSSMPAHR